MDPITLQRIREDAPADLRKMALAMAYAFGETTSNPAHTFTPRTTLQANDLLLAAVYGMYGPSDFEWAVLGELRKINHNLDTSSDGELRDAEAWDRIAAIAEEAAAMRREEADSIAEQALERAAEAWRDGRED